MSHDSFGRMPTFKALDTDGTVVCLGSFATTAPRRQGGYLVADQRVQDAQGQGVDSLSSSLGSRAWSP
jgi:DNA-binding transcriptional MocR family regulator